MFHSFSKLGAISQDKFYSPLFVDRSQAFAANNRFINIKSESSKSNSVPPPNSKSFTPFNKTKNDNSLSRITSSRKGNNLQVSNEITFQSSLINSLCNNDQKENLMLLSNSENFNLLKGKTRKISQNDIDKDIDYNFEKDSFNLSTLNHMNSQLLKPNTRKRISLGLGFNKATQGQDNKKNTSSNYLNKKRNIYMSEYEFMNGINDDSASYYEPIKPKPRNCTQYRNKHHNSLNTVLVNKDEQQIQVSSQTQERNKPGRKPKNNFIKSTKVYVCKLFYQLFSSFLNKIPPYSFNRRSFNRINKYIQYQNIIKEELPIDFDHFFKNFRVEDQFENYKKLNIISKAYEENKENKSSIYTFNHLNYIEQIQSISIDMLNPSLSARNLSLLLDSIKKINLLLRYTPIIKIKNFQQQGSIQIQSKLNFHVKKFTPFVVINARNIAVNQININCDDSTSEEKNNISNNCLLSIHKPNQSSNSFKKIFNVVKQKNPKFDYDLGSSESDSYNEESSDDAAKLDKLAKNDLFECRICGKSFISSCGLGGHMSKKHANSSEKYKAKCDVRKKREDLREYITKARKLFCEKFSLDYEKLNKSKEGRSKMRRLMKEKSLIYKECIKEIREEVNKILN